MPNHRQDVECPMCGEWLAVPDELEGRSVRCPSCEHVVSEADTTRAQGIVAHPRAAENRKRVVVPRRTTPIAHSGGIAGLVFGIVALVLALPALALIWLPILRLAMLVVAGLGLIVGIAGTVTAAVRKEAGLVLNLAASALSLLAFLAGFILTIVSLVSSNGTYTEPTPIATQPGWGQVFDPDGDCTITADGNALTIRVPPTPHDLSAEIGHLNAPRVLQEVEGDFRIQVKVCGTLHPTDATIAGRVAFQSGGLLLWSDSEHYVRLERAALNRNGPIKSYASWEMRFTPQFVTSPSVDLLESDTYLRLERRADQLLASVSPDGQQWTDLLPIQASFPSKVQVGVAAVNAAQQPLALRFEKLQLGR